VTSSHQILDNFQ